MNTRVLTIARYTLLEALRTRLPLLVGITLLLLLMGSLFIQSITVAESGRFQTGFYASGIRLAAVFIVALHVMASIARELNDKGLDLLLALDMPRGHYVLGKLAGFLVIAGLVAVVASAPLFWLAAPEAVVQWTLSLALELAIVAALALFCMVTFSQLVPAASFVLGFYLLARSLTAMRLMGAQPVAGGELLSHQVMAYMVEMMALVMPSFDLWTRTAWLTDQPASWLTLVHLGWQSGIYVVLLTAAAMFDLYRKNF